MGAIVGMTYKTMRRWLAFAALGIAAVPAYADSAALTPGNLVVSKSVYTGDASTVTIGEKLPPNCPATAKCPKDAATDNGAFPSLTNTNNVWNNDNVDASFGVTTPIFLDQITTSGTPVSTLSVPTSLAVTSFSSKSELALNLSADGKFITFMGYSAPPNTLDASNSNTPLVNDPTNPVSTAFYREVVQLDNLGNFQATDTNAYSGNNGRAAILADGFYYLTGNTNNGSGTPANLVNSTGVEIASPGQSPSTEPAQIGDFSITQYGYKADKAGKDNNFRGLAVFGNTLYVTKGSGSNGINTVYQVGNTGILPTLATAANTPITILPGFPTALAKNADSTFIYPFGIWFANANTLYVGDEGDGNAADAATSTTAGLQKWSLINGTWKLDYVLQNGLNLGVPYGVADYPTSLNPATDGLRNISGKVNGDGTVSIYAVTSTVSANGDQGADPNKLVTIKDVLANTTAAGAASETFTTLKTAGYKEVLRGVCFTPGTNLNVPLSLPVTESGLLYNRRTQTFTGTVTVTNNTSAAVSGPLMVILANLTPGVTLTNSALTVNGSPAISLGSQILAPGQSAVATVVFSNPSNAPINFTPEVVPES
jgi:hypothetical protein